MMKQENDIQRANPTVWVHAREQSGKQSGASMVEFALLIALVALIAIPAVNSLGKSVETKFIDASYAVAGEGSIQCEPGSGDPPWPACLP